MIRVDSTSNEQFSWNDCKELEIRKGIAGFKKLGVFYEKSFTFSCFTFSCFEMNTNSMFTSIQNIFENQVEFQIVHCSTQCSDKWKQV